MNTYLDELFDNNENQKKTLIQQLLTKKVKIEK